MRERRARQDECRDGRGEGHDEPHAPEASAGAGASLAASVPLYEYRCPNGHLFEVIHRMTEDGPCVCEVCGEAPLQRVLHPVAVHYKGQASTRRTTAARKILEIGEATRVVLVRLLVESRNLGIQAQCLNDAPPSRRSGSGESKKPREEALIAVHPRDVPWLPGSTWSPSEAADQSRPDDSVPQRVADDSTLGRTDRRAAAEPTCRGTSRASRGCPRSGRRCRRRRSRRRAGNAPCSPAEERNFTQPSGVSCEVERSVVIGFTSEPPWNGSAASVPTDVNFESTACGHGLLARRAEEVGGLARIEQVLADARVDQRPPAVHVLRSLREPPAVPLPGTGSRSRTGSRTGSSGRRRHVDRRSRRARRSGP